MVQIPASMTVTGTMDERQLSDALSAYLGNPDARLADVQVHASGDIVKTTEDGHEHVLAHGTNAAVILEAAKVLRSRANASHTQARGHDDDSHA